MFIPSLQIFLTYWLMTLIFSPPQTRCQSCLDALAAIIGRNKEGPFIMFRKNIGMPLSCWRRMCEGWWILSRNKISVFQWSCFSDGWWSVGCNVLNNWCLCCSASKRFPADISIIQKCEELYIAVACSIFIIQTYWVARKQPLKKPCKPTCV